MQPSKVWRPSTLIRAGAGHTHTIWLQAWSIVDATSRVSPCAAHGPQAHRGRRVSGRPTARWITATRRRLLLWAVSCHPAHFIFQTGTNSGWQPEPQTGPLNGLLESGSTHTHQQDMWAYIHSSRPSVQKNNINIIFKSQLVINSSDYINTNIYGCNKKYS